MINKKLKFQFGNAKLNQRIAILNLPAGWTCPSAKECLSKFNVKLNRIVDGRNTMFRCFGVTEERFPAVRNLRWYNFNLLREQKTVEGLVELITTSMPDTSYVRPHASSGDFFNENYFVAWLNVAINNPEIVFYTYTKEIPFIVKYKKLIPDNFRLTASFGGKHDNLIHEHSLKFAKVFFSETEAKLAGLELDRDDSHAYNKTQQSFGLLLHGMQPKNTLAAKSWYTLMKSGKGYSSKSKVVPSRNNSVTINIK